MWCADALDNALISNVSKAVLSRLQFGCYHLEHALNNTTNARSDKAQQQCTAHALSCMQLGEVKKGLHARVCDTKAGPAARALHLKTTHTHTSLRSGPS